MKNLAFAALSAFLLAGAVAPAAQADVLWTVSGTFDDTGTFSGTFSINQYGQFTDWDITTTDGTTDTGYHYTPGTTFQAWAFPNAIEFASTGYDTDFVLTFADDLGTAEPLNPIIGGYQGPSRECQGSYHCFDIQGGDIRYVVDGFATAGGGVPEPVTLSLLGAGLAGMGAMRRRKSA